MFQRLMSLVVGATFHIKMSFHSHANDAIKFSSEKTDQTDVHNSEMAY